MANEEKRVADILFDFIFGNNLIPVKIFLPLRNYKCNENPFIYQQLHTSRNVKTGEVVSL